MPGAQSTVARLMSTTVQPGAATSALRVRATALVSATLFVAVALSAFVFVEPAPYEGLVAIMALACLAAGLAVDRRLVPLVVVMVAWAVGGLAAMAPVSYDTDGLIYTGVTIYLQATTILFAIVFSVDTARRLAVFRAAYMTAAVGVALVAIGAYFGVVPRADLFLYAGRAQGTFKDPNVYGPFLILPLLLLIQTVLFRGPRPLALTGIAILLVGLLISFSRGAWGHFAFSAAIMVALLFVTSPSSRFRARLVGLTLVGSVAAGGFVALILSVGPVAEMFEIRASLVQSYDDGRFGRFGTQQQALGAILAHPNGMGPLQFGRTYGMNPHNVYLQTFLSYGWLGGFAYLALTAATLAVGLRAALSRAPWQPMSIAAFATFAGLAAEGAIIDTDHWRHYFLVVGLIWGLAAASERHGALTASSRRPRVRPGLPSRDAPASVPPPRAAAR